MEVVEPGVNVHGLPVKPPVPPVENEAVPAGADFAPESVSETSTVQVVLPFVPGVLSRGESIRQDIDMVTARINYRFGGPIVAKY